MLKPRWLDRVVSVTLSGDEPSKLRLSWRTKPKAITALADELFGKRILFTDRDEWSIAEVVTGYRSQSQVEADFRQMKDPRVVSFSPMFHFTDQKKKRLSLDGSAGPLGRVEADQPFNLQVRHPPLGDESADVANAHRPPTARTKPQATRHLSAPGGGGGGEPAYRRVLSWPFSLPAEIVGNYFRAGLLPYRL